MSDEVGKVSLGLELVGGSDLSKQVSLAADTIGEQLTKSLKATFGGFSLKEFSNNISQTLKTTTETSLKGIVDGMESSVAAVEGRLLKVIGVADKAMKDSIESSRVAAEAAIDGIGGRLGKLKLPFFKVKADSDDLPETAASTPTAPAAPKKSTKAVTIDEKAVKAEIENLTAVLDNVNAKIDVQKQKLAGLKEAYESTFDDARKIKIQEKIVNTEAVLLRLTQTSDKTAKKIWELEDSLERAGQAAQHTEKPVESLGQKMIQANKPLKEAKGSLDRAAKAASKAGSSFSIAGRGANVMGNSMTRALGRILKQVFVFAVLYNAIRSFNDYLIGSLKTNAQFAASLNAIQTNLRVAFQPIYEAILPAINALMSFLAKATAYIAAFISALFGKTYQQSYQAAKGIETAKNAMKGYGSAAKKAGKEAKGALAGFDELNTLDFSKNDAGVDDAGGGGGADGFEMQQPDMDITGIQAKMDELAAEVQATFEKAWGGIKNGWDWMVATFGPSFQTAWGEISPVLDGWVEQYKNVFNDIITLGEPLKNWIITGLVPYWQNGITLAGHVLAGLLDTILMIVSSIWTAAFPILKKLVTEGLPLLTSLLMGAQEIFGRLFDVVKSIFDRIWKEGIDPTLQLISKIILDTLDIIFGFWDKWGKDIINGVKTTFDKIKEIFNKLWDKFLGPVWKKLLNTLSELWEKHLKGLLTELGNFIGKLVTASQDIFNKFIAPIISWLVDKLGPIFAEIFNGVIGVVGRALGSIIDAAKDIIKALGGITDFIAGVFTGDWKRAWNGIKTFFSGITDAISGLFKGAINVIIDSLNWMIQQINKLKIDIPEWVPGIGGKTLGFTIPELPRLAKGGLAFGPTLAMVGDNRGASVDPEVVSPLSKLQEMIGANNQPMIDVLLMILDALRNNDKTTVIQIGETELGRAAIQSINSVQRQAGKTLLNV